MTSKKIAQTNQQQNSEKPQESGILQRAAVHSVSDAGVQSTEDKEAQPLSNSAFSKDFSRVPISTTKSQQFQAINLQSHPVQLIQAKLTQGKGKITGDRQVSSEAQHPNKTGLPDRLKAGFENLSGLSMDNVRVHYNSSKPTHLNALAYTQGTEIHVAPGQEKHLPHEVGHVVQQMQGRVKPTMQAKGVAINDDQRLEKEADEMGAKAVSLSRQFGNKKIHNFDDKQYKKGSIVQQQIHPTVQLVANPNVVAAGGDREGNYGYFEHYRNLSINAAENSKGILVQHVTRKFNVQNSQGRQLSANEINDIATQLEGTASADINSYYEAWYIPQGQTTPNYDGLKEGELGGDDIFSLTSIGWDRSTKTPMNLIENKTSGSFKITGTLTFYVVKTLKKKADTVCQEYGFDVDTNSPAGVLPYAKTKPNKLNDLESSQSVTKTKTVTWDCNKPDSNNNGAYAETEVTPASDQV